MTYAVGHNKNQSILVDVIRACINIARQSLQEYLQAFEFELAR